MLSFRQYLIEIYRTADEAGKLLNRVLRKSNIKHSQPNLMFNIVPNMFSLTKDTEKKVSLSDEEFLKKKPIRKEVLVKNISSDQKLLFSDLLRKKIFGQIKKHNPDDVQLFKIGNKYLIADGNHRVAEARLKGWTHIEALVLEI